MYSNDLAVGVFVNSIKICPLNKLLLPLNNFCTRYT